MSKTLAFDVLGIPIAQARPRFFQLKNGGIKGRDPEESKSWKETVKWQAIESWRPNPPIEGAMEMRLIFTLPRPTSLPKKVKRHAKKPDLDNLVKAIQDALEGVCYLRDAQIDALFVRKVYGPVPGVRIEIEVEVEV